MVKRLVIADFDGTIYDGDSMRDFARFLDRRRYFLTLLLIAFPYMLSLLGMISTDKVKRTFLRRCFGGKSREELILAGKQFFEIYHSHLFPSAKSYFQARGEEGIRCVVVSASCREWLLPFCEALNVELLCTELEYDLNGRTTGNWKGANIKGKEKVALIQQQINLAEYEEILAFGNSRSDKKMTTIAHTYYHCYFSR